MKSIKIRMLLAHGRNKNPGSAQKVLRFQNVTDTKRWANPVSAAHPEPTHFEGPTLTPKLKSFKDPEKVACIEVQTARSLQMKGSVEIQL